MVAALSFGAGTLPEVIFLSPHIPRKVIKLHFPKAQNIGGRGCGETLVTKIRAAQSGKAVVLDEKDKELEARLNGSLNGNGAAVDYNVSNGSVVDYSNEVSTKYVNGNVTGSVPSESEMKIVVKEAVISRKRTIEDIGQEEAWFKRNGQDQVE
ncbi:hypothetical protein M569_01968, partial [Genlisea aurea]